MESLFASHKGRAFKKYLFAAIGLAIVMMIFKPGGGGPTAAEQAARSEREYQQQVSYARVYSDAAVSPTPTPEPSQPTGGNVEAIVTSDVKALASEFILAWTTYDFQTPPTYGTIPNVSKDAGTNDNLKGKHDALVKSMVASKELSTGSIGSLNINSLEYKGDDKRGTGTAVIKATMNITISNDEVGSAGSSVVRTYEIHLSRQENAGMQDRGVWVVVDLITLN